MGLFVYRERRRRLGKVHQFTNLASTSRAGGISEENGRVPQTNHPPSPILQPRLGDEIPIVPSSSYPQVITRFGTARVLSPPLTSPEFFDYQNQRDQLSPS